MWCLIVQEFIDGDQSALCEWLMLLQILKKVVPVKWAEAAGGRLGVKTPNIKNIGVVVCTGQFHLDQRKMIGQHRIRAFFAAVAFFKAESHVHLMRFPFGPFDSRVPPSGETLQFAPPYSPAYSFSASGICGHRSEASTMEY